MYGYQITFFTQQDRIHDYVPLAQWLVDEAKKLGIRGATLSGAIQGLGHDGITYQINLFDLSDQPVQVTLVVNAEEAERLLNHLTQKLMQDVFYVLMPVEFGTIGNNHPVSFRPRSPSKG